MRTALGGTGRSVEQLRSQMGRNYKMRLFSDVLRQASTANSEIARLRATMLALTAVTGTSVTGGFAAAFLLETADASNRLNNQLRTITDTEENLIAVRKRLYDVSQDARADLQSTVTLYARVTRAAETFGKSQEDLVRVAQTVQKAFAVGGASQQEASGAAIQLSQGIASDRFSGDEYRSVSENAPVLLQAMAKSIGVTIGGLRKLAFEGKLTGKVVTDAILASSDAIDESFSKTIPTVSQSLTRLNNAFLQNIGETDFAYGVTGKLAAGLTNLSQNFGEVAKWAGIATAAIGALFAGRGATSLVGKAGGALSGLLVGQQGLAAKDQIVRLANLRTQVMNEMAALRSQAGATIGASGKTSFVATPANLAIMDQYVEKSKLLAAVNTRAALATTKLTASTRAFAVAGRAGAGVMSLFGGPIGIAFLAAVGTVSYFGAEAAKSAERTEKLKKEMIDLGYVSKEFADQIDGASKSLKDLTIDELRSKIGDLKEEIFRQKNGRPWWEMLFGGGEDNLTENIDKLKNLSDVFELQKTLPYAGMGTTAGFDRQNDQEFIGSLLDLAKLAKDGTLTAKQFDEQWAAVSPTFQNVSKKAADMATAIRAAVAEADGAAKFVADQEEKLASLQRSGDAPAWLTTHVNDTQRMAADSKAVKDWLAALQSVSGEMEKQAAFTPEQERLEFATDKVVKAWQDYNKELGITEIVSRDMARQRAAEILRITDETEAAGKLADLRDSLNAKGLTLVDRDAVMTVNDLLDQFETGKVPVETMQERLEEISKLHLSGAMDGLIEKIVAAIPELATLLGIAQSFPGVTPNGTTRGRGALGRTKRAGADRAQIGAGVASAAINDAGLSERDAAIKASASNLVDDAKKAGGSLSRKDATAAAAKIYDLDQAQKDAAKSADDAADATKSYADGMADLATQLALAPLGEFISKVYDAAEGVGLSKDELNSFIAAVTSDGLDAAPDKFKRIADAMRGVNASNIMQGLTAERDMLFKSDVDRNIYDTLKDSGIELDSVQGRIIANQIRMTAALSDTRDIAVDFAQTFRTSFAKYMADAEYGATFTERLWRSAWQAIIDATTNALETIAPKLMEVGINGLLDNLLGTGSASSGGSNIFGTILNAVLGGVTGGLTGGGATGGTMGNGLWGSAIFNAKGNVYSGPGINALSNRVINQPTPFMFAQGAGILGEDGYEGILPLRRTARGDLGVQVANQNIPTAANDRGISIVNHITGSRQDAAAIARMVTSQIKAQVPDAIRDYQKNPYKRHMPMAAAS